MSNFLIETNHLTKKFGSQCSVNNLSLHVKEGEIYGFLGPNGAGKSTTMKMLLSLLIPTQGEISIFGKSIKNDGKEILRDIGSLIEEPAYYSHLTGKENLQIIQQLLHLPNANVDKALEIVRLTESRNKLVKNYSLGMKQRLGIALAIVKFPKLLILDEPTNGLDPSGIHEMRELIKSFPKEYGMTVMISSHILSEIEQMVTKIGIINQGNLLFEGDLKQLETKGELVLSIDNTTKASTILKENGFEILYENTNGLVLPEYSKMDVSKMIQMLVLEKINIYEVRNERQSLEDVFLEMTASSREENTSWGQH